MSKQPVRRQASFGGVAALFGEEDHVGASAVPDSNSKTKSRQASFGGVASLFGDLDEEEDQMNVASTGPAKVAGSRKAQPSFGGVAAMFGGGPEDEEGENVGAAGAAKSSGKGRTASFGGVAALFGEDESDEVAPVPQSQPPVEEKTIPKINNNQDSVGKLPEVNKPVRRGKRDPSISNIADMFDTGPADEDESNNNNGQKQINQEPIVEDFEAKEIAQKEEINNQLKDKVKKYELIAGDLTSQLEQKKKREQELRKKIKTLLDHQQSLRDSKLSLIKILDQEICRMRSVMDEYYVSDSPNSDGKAATVA